MSYPGTKGGQGVWQWILNHVPDCDAFVEPFAGRMTIARKFQNPPRIRFGIESDPQTLRETSAILEDEARQRLGNKSPDILKPGGLWISGGCGIQYLEDTAARFYELRDRKAMKTSPFVITDPKILPWLYANATAEGCTPTEFAERVIESAHAFDLQDPAKKSSPAAGGSAAEEKFAASSFELVLLIDPPYPIESRRSGAECYRHEFTAGDHARTLKAVKRLAKLPGVAVIVCSYDNKRYNDALKSWRTDTFKTRTRRGNATEKLWLSYPPPSRLQDYSSYGADKLERLRMMRIRRNEANKIRRKPEHERHAFFQMLANQFPEELRFQLERKPDAQTERPRRFET